MSNNVNSAVLNWFSSGDIDDSSRTFACAALGLPIKKVSHPGNSSDFNRCLILLKFAPPLRSKMFSHVAPLSDHWASLIDMWSEIEETFIGEAGLGFEKSSSAPKTDALLRQIESQSVASEDKNTNKRSFPRESFASRPMNNGL